MDTFFVERICGRCCKATRTRHGKKETITFFTPDATYDLSKISWEDIDNFPQVGIGREIDPKDHRTILRFAGCDISRKARLRKKKVKEIANK